MRCFSSKAAIEVELACNARAVFNSSRTANVGHARTNRIYVDIYVRTQDFVPLKDSKYSLSIPRYRTERVLERRIRKKVVSYRVLLCSRRAFREPQDHILDFRSWVCLVVSINAFIRIVICKRNELSIVV